MRVLHVLFSPRMAGSERYCVDLANAQAAQGHEVHVVGSPDSPMARALGSRVRFHSLRLPLLRGWRLRQLMTALAPDVCHAHLSPACKALARAPASVATVATLHVGYKAHQHGGLDGLVCVNHAQLNRLGGYGGHKRVIPNWLPASAQAAAGSRQQHRAALGVGEEQLLIGAVGRLHASKGMDVLVSAFRAVAPAQARLVILGEGPQRAALQKLCAGDPRIQLLGFQDDVAGHLAAMDLFVSPSREESFGLAILEAMAADLPMVATATDGPAEILRGSAVELVAPGSVPALGEALTRAIAAAGTPRSQAYALHPFEQARGVGLISDFYAQVIQDVQRRKPAPRLQAAQASHV